jgi:hypothetical protein
MNVLETLLKQSLQIMCSSNIVKVKPITCALVNDQLTATQALLMTNDDNPK